MNNSKLSRLWPCVAVVLAVFMLTGCQENRLQFNESIHLSLDSVRAGDLQMADKHLDDARPNAKSHNEKTVVKSIDDLIDGAQAMMTGDVTTAQNEWSSIPDPHFSREVRVKSDAIMGVKIPLVALAREVRK